MRWQIVQHGWATAMDTPKTDGSDATIALDVETGKVLRAHRARQNRERLAAGEHWIHSGLVFTTETGAPLHPAVATRQQRLDDVDASVDGQLIKDGTLLEFRTVTQKERSLLSEWLAADANRAKATWLNDRSSPILWAADGKTYSPNALVKHILSHVTNDLRRKLDGSRYFFVPGRGSLATIAQEGLDDAG